MELLDRQTELWRFVDVGNLQEIQNRFSEATGLAAIIADRDGQAITRPSRFCRLCQRIRSTELGQSRCFESDAGAGRAAALSLKPYTHHCHAGLLDVAAPVVVDGRYVGSVLCGQVLSSPADDDKVEDTYQRVKDLGISRAEVATGLQEITALPAQQLKAAADLLQMVASYIVHLAASVLAQQRLMEESRARLDLERSLKEMELRVLQSQVNPHFLFNSLNTVARMALFESAQQTQELVFRMTRILRFSLSRIDQLIPVREELNHVEDYLYIQQTRFGDRVRFWCDVDAEVMEALIPILTVQPLVENAVVRGLEPLVEGGEVTVRGWAEGSVAVIEVQDTGVGLDPARGNALLTPTHPPSAGGHTTGLGIPNVHQRLQHFFGPAYGLSFQATERGTRVQVRAPLQRSLGGLPIGAKALDR